MRPVDGLLFFTFDSVHDFTIFTKIKIFGGGKLLLLFRVATNISQFPNFGFYFLATIYIYVFYLLSIFSKRD